MDDRTKWLEWLKADPLTALTCYESAGLDWSEAWEARSKRFLPDSSNIVEQSNFDLEYDMRISEYGVYGFRVCGDYWLTICYFNDEVILYKDPMKFGGRTTGSQKDGGHERNEVSQQSFLSLCVGKMMPEAYECDRQINCACRTPLVCFKTALARGTKFLRRATHPRRKSSSSYILPDFNENILAKNRLLFERDRVRVVLDREGMCSGSDDVRIEIMFTLW